MLMVCLIGVRLLVVAIVIMGSDSSVWVGRW